MDEYGLLDTLSHITNKTKVEFDSSLSADTDVKSSYHRIEFDLSWLDMMEDTARYIENILKNPKKFIINEEELVLVEKSKKVTVESVIHLCQHTNLITEFDEESGEVKPSKILNVLKEETLDMYENRFLYTLILNMRTFLDRYGKIALQGSSINSEKNMNYKASAEINGEKVDFNLSLKANHHENLDEVKNGMTVKQRIMRMNEQIDSFCSSELYKNLERAHVPIVRSPIRKTNVILKNPNFQRAEALWNFMERYDKDSKREKKYKKNLSKNEKIKRHLETSFLLNYAIIDKTSNEEDTEIDWDKINTQLLDKCIKNYLFDDPNLDETLFLNYVKKEFKNIKKDQNARFAEIKRLVTGDLNTHLKEVNQILKQIKI